MINTSTSYGVVALDLGKGEVQGSSPCGSTINPQKITAYFLALRRHDSASWKVVTCPKSEHTIHGRVKCV